jgi:hypothetical protein
VNRGVAAYVQFDGFGADGGAKTLARLLHLDWRLPRHLLAGHLRGCGPACCGREKANQEQTKAIKTKPANRCRPEHDLFTSFFAQADDLVTATPSRNMPDEGASKIFTYGCIGIWIDFYPTLAAKNKNAARMGHPYFYCAIISTTPSVKCYRVRQQLTCNLQ